MKVDFLIVGAQKCGTTSLYDALSRHPLIQGSSEKEPGFWVHNEGSAQELEDYHDLFSRPKGEVKWFEASTIYTFYPLRGMHVWEKVFRYNPDMKIVYIVRNPIDRVVSGWMHDYERGWEHADLEQAIIKNRSYTDITRYYTQIKPWIDRFGRESVLILDFDDLKIDFKDVVKRVCNFIGVRPIENDEQKLIHSNDSVNHQKVRAEYTKFTKFSSQFQESAPSVIKRIVRPIWRSVAYNKQRNFSEKPHLSQASREMILNLLALEIDQLEILMDCDLEKWRKFEHSQI